MSATDLLQALAEGLFVLVFLVVTVTALRRPRRATIDIALLFGTVALILAASAALATLSFRLRTDVAAFGDTLIMALPYLLLRLADDFTPVPRRWKTLGGGGFALSSLGFILAAQPLVLPPVLRLVWSCFIVGYFVTYTGYVARTFVRAARPAHGVTKRRLHAVSAGSLCLGMILVIDGASTVWPAHLEVWRGLIAVLLLGCGVCYFVGFAPPAWLRRAWQDPELRAFLGLTAELASLPTLQAVVGALEEGVAAALGASRAAIGLWDERAHVLRFSPAEEPVDPAVGHTLVGQVFTTQRAIFSDNVEPDTPVRAAQHRATGVAAIVVVPLIAGEQTRGVLCAYAARASLFVEDDLALARLLADQAAVVLEGRALIDAVAQRSAQLEEAVTALEAQSAERQRAEEARSRLATIVECSPDAIIGKTREGIITSWNGGATLLYGYTAEEVVGRSIAILTAPDSPDESPATMHRVGQGGQIERYETVRLHKEARRIDVEVTIFPITAAAGQVTEIASITREITARKRAEEALQQSNTALARASQVKSEFLANMSHELRTPLNAIIGFSEVLQDETFGALSPRQQRYVGHVLDSGRHLLALVNDILDLSKVEAGKMELHLDALDLAALLAETREQMLPLAQTKGVDLRIGGGTETVRIQADRARFVQILYNLLSNALKFTPAGGTVTVSWRVEGGGVALAVADTGIGIAPEDQERVFAEFQQIDSALGRQQQGTGLGLALTRRLVELHGGTLTLHSALGQGSTFTVSVPRAPDVVAVPADGPRGAVLVVEDTQGAYDLLSLYLSAAGYGVQRAQHGAAVVPQARALQPVAITLDILLQEETGWPVLEQLRADPQTRAIPVVIVSIVDEPATGFALGASAYLVKPVARAELLATLDRVINGGDGTGGVTAGRMRRVLAVDDQREALELIALALAGSRYQLIRATSGAEALELLTQEPPDVLLVDLMMAPLSGFDVIDAVVANPRTRDIPIIVVTAHDLTVEEMARLNGHVAATLSKSGFTKEALLRELQRATRRARAGGAEGMPAGG